MIAPYLPPQDDDSRFTFREGEPAWVTASLKFFPAPIYAMCAALGGVLVGAIFLINALIHGEVLLWVVTAVLGIFSLLVTIASLVRSVYHPNLARETRYASTQGKPTLILVVFLSASLVWWTALFRLFLEWFKPNGVDPTKRAVAVGVTMAYALVMQFGGRRLLREHFPRDQPEVLRSVEVTGLQAVVVFGVILLVSVFCVWLLV
jgi:hypothetical protein